jgi:hypothetical protein
MLVVSETYQNYLLLFIMPHAIEDHLRHELEQFYLFFLQIIYGQRYIFIGRRAYIFKEKTQRIHRMIQNTQG